jgi:ribose/xylose/arabinose/galactoside ABC-type transport system permease subunit/ABC-type branched-subunit amino acid transport system ATPase component
VTQNTSTLVDVGRPPALGGDAGQGGRVKLIEWLRWRSKTIPGEASGRLGLGVVALGLFIFFSVTAEGYFTPTNIATIGLTVASLLIAVTGSMMLLVAGTVDISIGAMFALVGIVVAQVATTTYNAPLAIIAGLATGAILGLINGVAVRYLQLSPLIVTIGTMIIFGGLAFVFSGGLPISGFPPSLTTLGRISLGSGVSIILVVAIVVFAIGSYFLIRTKHGLRIHAIGGDERAAIASGVAAGKTIIGLFVLNGLLIGLAAALVTARLGTASPGMGAGFEFDVLTAVILGGVSFGGGGGRPLGVIVGVATIGVLQSGLIFLGVKDYWQDVAMGSILILALISDQLLQSTRDAGGFAAAWRRWRGKSVDAAVRRGADGDEEEDLPRLATKRQLGPVVLEARGLRREFGAVRALRGVDVSVRAGEVLCLVGDNGAGKSSVIKILSGIDKPDGGTIEVGGRPVTLSSAHEAQDAGIRTVFQDLALVPALSVAHNFVLGNEPTKRVLGIIPVRDEKESERRTRAALEELGIDIPDLFTSVRRKSGGQRQAVAIARATGSNAPVVILDEPTAALGVKQTRLVLSAVRRLAEKGTAVILITHDIKSVFAVGDSVTVLRLGEVTHNGPVAEIDEHQLIKLMAGI